MNTENWVMTALRALAEQDRGREAPAHIEARLLQEFRRQRTRKAAQKRLRTLALAGLAAVAGLMVVFLAASREQSKPLPRQHRQAQRPEIVAREEPRPELVPEPAPKVLSKVRPAPVRTQPREVVTDFFPLLDVAPPFERGELLRVVVPASTMRRVGLPVNPDRLADPVYADVLVGQEGLARAIRFVSYEQ